MSAMPIYLTERHKEGGQSFARVLMVEDGKAQAVFQIRYAGNYHDKDREEFEDRAAKMLAAALNAEAGK